MQEHERTGQILAYFDDFYEKTVKVYLRQTCNPDDICGGPVTGVNDNIVFQRGIIEGVIGMLDETGELSECLVAVHDGAYEELSDCMVGVPKTTYEEVETRLLDEYGDVLFYAALLPSRRIFAESFAEYEDNKRGMLNEYGLELFQECAKGMKENILDRLKKVVFQGRADMHNDLIKGCGRLLAANHALVCSVLYAGTWEHGRDPIPEAMAVCTEKLKRRYPNGFSTHASKNREV